MIFESMRPVVAALARWRRGDHRLTPEERRMVRRIKEEREELERAVRDSAKPRLRAAKRRPVIA